LNYIFHLLIMTSIYTVLALSLNLVLGYGGMLSFCQAAFFGLGAYISTLLTMKAGWPFVPSCIAAILVTGGISYIVSIPLTAFRDDFFVLATVGFQMIVWSVLYNWTGLTGGPLGIPAIPEISIFGSYLSSLPAYFMFALIVAVLLWLAVWRLSASPYGRTLKAVRDDELASMALGKNVHYFRRTAFTIAGMLAASAGVLFAPYASYIDPTSFTVDESIYILCIVVIGGTGNLRGPIVGALTLVLMPEVLRFLHIPEAVAPNTRQVIYGLLLVLMMRFRPQGIAGNYAFD
jgi:branched-chain amino acid transport system permease protein